MGCRYGSARPHHDIPLMVDLYKAGRLKLDELVTATYPLEGVRDRARRAARRQARPRRADLADCLTTPSSMPLPGELDDLAKGLELGPLGRRRRAGHAATCSTADVGPPGRRVRSRAGGGSRSRSTCAARTASRWASPPRRINPFLTPTSLNERDQAAPGIWEGTDEIVTMSTCAGTHIDALAHVVLRRAALQRRSRRRPSRASGGRDEARGREAAADRHPRRAARRGPREGRRRARRDRAGLRDHRRRPRRGGRGRARSTVEPGDVVLRPHRRDAPLPQPATRKRYAMGVECADAGPVGPLRRVDAPTTTSPARSPTATPTRSSRPSLRATGPTCLAVHMLHVRDMGLIQGQNWDFEELAGRLRGRRPDRPSCWSPHRSRSSAPPRRRCIPSPSNRPPSGQALGRNISPHVNFPPCPCVLIHNGRHGTVAGGGVRGQRFRGSTPAPTASRTACWATGRRPRTWHPRRWRVP